MCLVIRNFHYKNILLYDCTLKSIKKFNDQVNRKNQFDFTTMTLKNEIQ